MQLTLNINPAKFANFHTFVLCNTDIDDCDTLTCIALLIYAIYITTNHYRHNTNPPFHRACDALMQAIREGAKHHPNAARVLDCRWNTPIPPIPIHL
jgi:hypothetical protein